MHFTGAGNNLKNKTEGGGGKTMLSEIESLNSDKINLILNAMLFKV